MIIKSGTVKSGDGVRAANYPLRQGDNERVIVLKDNTDQLIVADEFAVLKGRKNGLIHTTINPGREMTCNQWERALEAIRVEHGFNPDGPESFVIHECYRADGSMQQHGHLITAAADSETGKTYKRFRSMAKDEAVSRFLELEFGHQLVMGAHNVFSEKRMREMGRDDYANQIAALDGDNPRSAFNHDQHQQARRQKFDLPALRQQLKMLTKLDRSKQPRALAELIDREGLELADATEVGRGRSRIVIKTPAGVKDHNANRTLKINAAKVATFIKETKEYLNDLRTENSADQIREHAAGSTLGDHQWAGADSPEQSNIDQATECLAQTDGFDSQNSPSDELRGEEIELATAGADLTLPVQKFVDNRCSELTPVDIDPLPDLSDPNLMRKLAAMLKKSLGSAKQVIAHAFTPNQGMPSYQKR